MVWTDVVIVGMDGESDLCVGGGARERIISALAASILVSIQGTSFFVSVLVLRARSGRHVCLLQRMQPYHERGHGKEVGQLP